MNILTTTDKIKWINGINCEPDHVEVKFHLEGLSREQKRLFFAIALSVLLRERQRIEGLSLVQILEEIDHLEWARNHSIQFIGGFEGYTPEQTT